MLPERSVHEQALNRMPLTEIPVSGIFFTDGTHGAARQCWGAIECINGAVCVRSLCQMTRH